MSETIASLTIRLATEGDAAAKKSLDDVTASGGNAEKAFTKTADSAKASSKTIADQARFAADAQIAEARRASNFQDQIARGDLVRQVNAKNGVVSYVPALKQATSAIEEQAKVSTSAAITTTRLGGTIQEATQKIGGMDLSLRSIVGTFTGMTVAEAAVNALGAALDASRKSMENAATAAITYRDAMAKAEDAISGVATATFRLADARKEAARQDLLGAIASNQKEIARLESPGLAVRAGRVLLGQGGAMAEAADKVQAERLRASNASLLSESIKLVMTQGATAAAADKATGAVRHHADTIDEAARALQRLIEASQNFLGDLQQQTSEFGKSAVQIEAMKIAAATASAPTKALADAIRDQGDQLLGLMKAAEAVKAGDGLKTMFELVGADVEAMANQPLDDLISNLRTVDQVANDAAHGMETAFGNVGRAIGGITTAITGYRAGVAQLQRDQREGFISESQRITQERSLRVGSYGDMIEAGRGFFKEGSAGYELLGGAEKAFRILEFGLALQSIAMKGAEAAATVGAETAMTGATLAGTAIRTPAKAAEGIAGIFAALGPFGFPVAAAAAAVMVAAGVKVFGGGGGAVPGATDAADRQKAQGSGSVLGDAAAKSDSIAKSLALVEDHTNRDLEFSNQMLKSLRSIDGSIGAVANSLARTLSAGGALSRDGLNLGSTKTGANLGSVASGGLVGGLINGAMMGSFGGPIIGLVGAAIGAVVGALTSTKTTRTLQDQGLQFNDQSVGDIMSGGVSGDSYQQVLTTTKKKILGLTYSTKDKSSVETAALDDELNKQITLLIGNLKAGVLSAANVLGVTGAEATLNAFVVSIGKISLKDLSSSEISDALNAVFSKVGDDLAGAAIPGLEAVQKAGEGLFETLARVARDYQVVDVTLSTIGKTFGAVGLASLAARERLIDLAGGLDAFTEQTRAFAEAFLSKDEQIAPVIKAVGDEMARLGLSGIKTKDQFKALVLGLDVSTQAGAETYAALLAVAPAFAKVQDYVNALTGAANDNVSLTDQISAAHSALADAYDRESSALQDTITTFTDLAKSLRGYGDSLGSGAAGNLSPFAQAAAAKALFDQTDAAARGGDKTAAGQLQSVGEAYIAAQKVIAPTAQAVTQVVSAVRASVYAAAGAAQGQADAAQQQLDLLGKSVDGLLTVNASVLSVRDAIAALTGLQSQAATVVATASAPSTVAPAASTGLAGRDTYDWAAYLNSNPDVMAWAQAAVAQGIEKDFTQAAVDHYNNYGKTEGRSFANGTDFAPGGMSLVGERGPEIVNVPRGAQVIPNSALRSGNDNAALVNEIRSLRADLNAALDAIAMNTSKTTRILDRTTQGGEALRTVAAA